MRIQVNKIAVFFDAENVSAKKVPDILAWLSGQGEILFQRAYADWSMQHTKEWQTQITKTPITVYQQFHNKDTQVIDKAIMMDAVVLSLQHSELNTIAIVASDNGYYSLALRLRELGKQVIGIGEKKKCKPIWINSCNIFQYFEDIKDVDDDILLDNQDIEDEDIADFSLSHFIDQAYFSTPKVDNKNTALVSRLGESILRFKPDFKYSDYKTKSLLDLLARFPEKYKLTDDGKTPPTHFVERLANDELGVSDEKSAGHIERWIKRYGIIKDSAGEEYFFYIKEVLPECKEIKIRRGLRVEFNISRKPNPSAEAKRERTGYAKNIRLFED